MTFGNSGVKYGLISLFAVFSSLSLSLLASTDLDRQDVCLFCSRAISMSSS